MLTIECAHVWLRFSGELAKHIAQDIAEAGGIVTEEDLRAYAPQERQPVEGRFRNQRVVSAGAPFGGSTMMLGLQIVDQFQQLERDTSLSTHIIVCAMARGVLIW
jgi:gamma-glutamyltranspeptidase / glutathione hydrolase